MGKVRDSLHDSQIEVTFCELFFKRDCFKTFGSVLDIVFFLLVCPVTLVTQGKCPFSGATGKFQIRPQEPRYLRLKNWIEGTQAVDTLHQKADNVSDTFWKPVSYASDSGEFWKSSKGFGRFRVNFHCIVLYFGGFRIF